MLFRNAFLRVGMLLAVLFLMTVSGTEAATDRRHPPTCTAATVNANLYEVKCTDAGHDIVMAEMQAVNEGASRLSWNHNEMRLQVEVKEGTEVKWAVRDAQGNRVSGHYG